MIKEIFSDQMKKWFKNKEIKLNKPYPDIELFHLKSNNIRNISDLCPSDGRALVINFGSCSWPPFVLAYKDYIEIVKKYSKKADFITVYIKEAHPKEGWNFGEEVHGSFFINSPKDFEEKKKLALNFAREADPNEITEFYLDGMDDSACLKYGAHPERLFAIKN